MGSGNLVRLKTQDPRLKALVSYILCLVSCVLCLVPFCASADPSAGSVPDVISATFENAKLKEEVNLSGATLKELVGEHPGMSGLKQIALKTYRLAAPPGDPEIESFATAHRAKLVSEGWQMILRRSDEGRTVLIYVKEKEGVREHLMIVLITPSELSEMLLLGEIGLSALEELRSLILRSMPLQPVADFFYLGSSPSVDMEKAIARLERATEIQGEKTPLDLYYQLGAVHERLGNYEKALAYYDTLINDPDAHDWLLMRAYYGAAQASERLGRLDDARNYREPLEKYGSEAQAKEYHEASLDRFSDEGAIASWASLSLRSIESEYRQRPFRAETWVEEAEEMLYELGRPEKAIEIYQEVINSDPEGSDAASAQLMMGVVYGYMNQQEKQIEAFKKAVEKYPGAVNHKYLGEAYQKQGMYEEALEQYKIIMNDYPGSPEAVDAYLSAGKGSEMLGMTEEAEGYYTELIERYENDERPGVLAEKSLIRLRRGDSRPFLGLGFRFTRSMEGAPIVTVFENGPCKDAGVQPGDVLLAIDSKPTPNTRSVIRIIGWEKSIGDEVTLLIRREGEDEDIEVSVTLTETPEKLER